MKRILFITGTRADYGKIKSLIRILDNHPDWEVSIFVTGMHMQQLYGSTYLEVERSGCKNIFKYINTTSESTMDLTLSKTIEGLSSYIKECHTDLLVVHGDRVEALAGAIVGSLNNILVAHIEGGELSGTIDGLIRHAITKLSHIHFVANEAARLRLLQLGEQESSVHIIGSPDMDIMFSNDLPTLKEVRYYYDIPFESYGVVMYHPVTTEYDQMEHHAENLVNALLSDTHSYVVIYPNNDFGSRIILNAYRRLSDNPRFRILPSMRFEYFLCLLKEAHFILGNSSAGIREAPAYGIPCINIGSRQQNRGASSSVHNCAEETDQILHAISNLKKESVKQEHTFGKGNSAEQFCHILEGSVFFETSVQKQFKDLKR